MALSNGNVVMKIYFCDKCNESIPLKDINSNRITIDAGKIFCHECAPRPAKVSRTVNAPTTLVIMMLCIVLGGAAMAAWGDRLFDLRPPTTLTDRIDALDHKLASRMNLMDAEVMQIKRDLSEVPESGGAPGKLAKLTQDIGISAAAIQQLRHTVNALSDDLKNQFEAARKADEDGREAAKRESHNLHSAMERALADLEKLATTSGTVNQDLLALKDRLTRLEETRAAAPVTSEGAAPSVPAETMTAAEKKIFDNANNLLKDKSTANAPNRFQAIFELSQIKGRVVDEILVSVLGDETSYIRSTAIESLGQRGAKWAIGDLIPKLRDSDPYVRESAIKTLDLLIGRPIGLKPESTPAQFLAKITELQKWWAENRVDR